MGLLSQFSSKAEIHRRETLKRFDDFFISYFTRLNNVASDERMVTLIARSPDSQAAQAVARHGEQLAAFGCELRVVFANIEPASSFSEFVVMTEICTGQTGADTSSRWAKNPALLDAHEQLVLGSECCWSGDAMRRSADSRFALDLFEEQAGSTVELARMAFDGLWSASVAIPKSRFRNAAPAGTDPVIVQFDGPHDALMENTVAGAMTTRH